ncbi:unnamed protein product [Withania somnifera]
MLKEFFQQQLRIEMQWRETTEKHDREREEREEQRRTREESRAEKRDALLTTLLNKLIGENHP